MARLTYVIGHKSPDTDSIVSAIAYATYKKAKGIDVIPARIGPVAADTEYLLERFGIDEPQRIFSAKCTISEIAYDKPTTALPSCTIRDALNKIIKTETKTLYVVNKNKQLAGVLTLSGLNNLWMTDEVYLSEILKTATFDNIVKTLDAEIISQSGELNINGLVNLAPVRASDIEMGDVVVTSNPDKIRQAIKAKAGIIIIQNHKSIPDELLDEINKTKCNIIRTDFSAINISKLIYLTPTIDHVMLPANKVLSVLNTETVEDCLLKIAKTRFRSYPIIDENNYLIGSLSRYHLTDYERKQFILVDHNEKKQTIDDIEYADVIEIVDHHRFGGFTSDTPVSINCKVVGATASIIAHKFIDEKIKLDKNMAGLLLGAILSDTLNLNSPTTTNFDREAVDVLKKKTRINPDKLYEQIVSHGESLLNRKTTDIIRDDYKEYKINGLKIGVAQATCKNEKEYIAVKDTLINTMKESGKITGLDLMLCMLTDPTGKGSYLLATGSREELVTIMYPDKKKNNFINGLISRKKQLLPEVIKALS